MECFDKKQHFLLDLTCAIVYNIKHKNLYSCAYKTRRVAMTTNFAIDSKLVDTALKAGGLKSEEDTIHQALLEFIARHKPADIVVSAEKVPSVNKAELIGRIAERTELTKKDSAAVLNAMMEAITEALISGDKVSLLGFGIFEARERAARMGRNPKTKEEIHIPASKAPVFRAGKQFKDAVKAE